MTPKAAFAMNPLYLDQIFTPDQLAELQRIVEVDPSRIITDYAAQDLSDIEVLITSWGVPRIDATALDRMPKLAHIAHTAGTVKYFADEAIWDRDIVVTTAAAANAVPVGEYTLAWILLASKQVPWVLQAYKDDPAGTWQGQHRRPFPGAERHGAYGQRVGIISASIVGRLVIEHLLRFDFDVVLYDPFVGAEDAAALGVTKVELAELFATSDIVSLHAPDLPATKGLVSRELLESMPDGATFINTARPAIVDQAALVELLAAGRHYAIIDVTDPEPLPAGHPLLTMSNVIVTPHWAGSSGLELHRMARLAIDAVEDRLSGGVPRGLVTRQMLATMA